MAGDINISERCQRILDYIAKNGSIDSEQAKQDLEEEGLSKVVSTLRKKGYDIVSIKSDPTSKKVRYEFKK